MHFEMNAHFDNAVLKCYTLGGTIENTQLNYFVLKIIWENSVRQYKYL